jgi:hypothetical protein
VDGGNHLHQPLLDTFHKKKKEAEESGNGRESGGEEEI